MLLERPKLRTDLAQIRRDDGERAVTLLKDPLRSVIYELNDLQLTIAESFDGKRTAHDVAELLAADHGLPVPVARVERFAEFLAERYLLEVTCYDSAPVRMRAELRRELRRRNLRVPRTRELVERRYTDAARCLARRLDSHPGDVHARALYDALHAAFFRSQRLLPSYMRMVHLWNPDRFLGWLDARIGKLLFSAWGIALFAVLMLAGLYVVPDIDPPSIREINWSAVLLAPCCVGVITLFLHELAHGLACKHYGGRVESMGIMLFYGVIPGAYCDVTETHTFRSRRHRIIVYLAGVLVELPVLSAWLWCYHLSTEAFFLRNAILVWITYDVYVVARNIVPFVKGYDGYYALCHHLDIPELNERAFAYLRRLAAEHVFGVPPERERATPRERRIFLWFGLTSIVYYVSFYYGIWFRFLFPLLIQHWQTAGLVIAVAYASMVLGTRALRALQAFSKFLWLERRRIFTPRRSLGFAAALASLVTIALAPYRSWADGEFRTRPQVLGVVRALEPGLVASVAVREGSRVRRGDVIARLDDRTLVYRERMLDAQIEAAEQHLLALTQGARTEQLAVAVHAEQRARTLARLSEHAHQRGASLLDRGLLQRAESDALEQASADDASQARVAARTLELVRAPTRPEDVAAARAQLDALRSARADVRGRRERLVLRSPNDGTLVAPLLHERIHEYLQRGAVLAEVHDLARVHAEVRFADTALLTSLAAGQELQLRAAGDPHRAVLTRVTRVQPRADDSWSGARAQSGEFENPGWPTGLSGRARVYFPDRSIAFNWIGGPLLQLVDFSLWTHT